MRAVGPRIRDAMVKATSAEFAQQERGILATMVSDPGKQQVALGWALRSDRATVAEAIVELMTTDLRAQVATIHTPTLVIATWAGWGVGRDPIEHSFTQQYGELHGAKVVVAESAKHFVMWDDLGFLFAQLDALLP